jgi:hypothetical protein
MELAVLQVRGDFEQRAYLTSAIASINVWNRLGVAFRWTPPSRQKAPHVAAP